MVHSTGTVQCECVFGLIKYMIPLIVQHAPLTHVDTTKGQRLTEIVDAVVVDIAHAFGMRKRGVEAMGRYSCALSF